MTVTWVLIANARRARFFERDPDKADFAEVADFIYPYGLDIPNPGSVRCPRCIGVRDYVRALHGGKQSESRTDRGLLGKNKFATQLAGFINQGVEDQRCDSVGLVATDHMLEEIRRHLNDVAHRKIRCCVAADLTRFRGRDLQCRIKDIVTLRR